eukprot:jgi/Tetstr1/456241/TSEL_043003.t1
MRSLFAFITGALAMLMVVGMFQMRAAMHARTSAGDQYHRLAQHAERPGNWNRDWDALKSAVEQEHQQRMRSIEARGAAHSLQPRTGDGALRIRAGHADLRTDISHKQDPQQQGQALLERGRVQQLAVARQHTGNAAMEHGRAWVGELEPSAARSGDREVAPEGDEDREEEEEEEEEGEGLAEEVVAGQLSDQQPEGGEGEVQEVEGGRGGAGQQLAGHSQSSIAAAGVAADAAPPRARRACGSGPRGFLCKLDPVRVRVANMMGNPIRVPGLSDRTQRPCIGPNGQVTLCGAPRTPRTARSARSARAKAAPASAGGVSDDVGGLPGEQAKPQPGDEDYRGVDMFKFHFFGSFVMNQEKYSKLPEGEPVRITKYKSQCALDQWPSPSAPPRGCDTAAATADLPRSRGYDRVGSVNPEFLQLLPEVDVFRAMPKFESCAVVGNGGSLLLNEMGAEINAHQAIIRFNGGITKGFEKHVGSRTTIRILNTQHIGFHEFPDEILLQHATNLGTMEAALIYRLKHPEVNMFITDGDFHQYVLDEMGDGAASNGFYGVVFSKEMCKSVTLFGFYKSWGGGGSVKYHYYDKVEPNGSQKSRDDKETPALVSFLSRHRGLYRYGEPTAVGAMEAAAR